MDRINNKSRILVMGAHPYVANRGCAAMCMGILEVLREKYPEALISIGGYNYEQQNIDSSASEFSSKYGKDSKIDFIPCRQNSRGKQIIEFLRLLKNTYLVMLWRLFLCFGIDLSFALKKEKMLRIFFDMDMVVDLKWGDQFTDIYGIYTTLVWFHESIIPIILRKPYFLFPQTIGPFNSILTRCLARFILDRVSIIMARENETKDYLIRMGIDERKIRLVPDCAFYLSSGNADHWIEPKLLTVTNERPLVGITLRDISFPGHSRVAQKEFLELMLQVVRHVQFKYNAVIVMISHDGSVFSSEAFHEFKLMIGRDTEVIHLEQQPYSTEKVRAVISRCHITISAYLHANIAAFAMNVPTIGFSYSYKTKGIFEMMGQKGYVCDLNSLSHDKVIGLVDAIWKDREIESLVIKSQMKMIRDQRMNICNL